MAQPATNRWHKQPTALAGGIAIYFGMSIPLFRIADFGTIFPHFLRNSSPAPLPSIDAVIWVGITFFFIQFFPEREREGGTC